MSDVNISKFRAQVIRTGSTPASPGFVVSEGQNPVDPSGSGQTHLPVTIATVSTGLSITESQILSGAGLVSQYIRGDGSLADFPATTGGGSSVSYYLNGSVSQGTIGGVAYKEINRTPVFGAGTDISISADGYIASFITDALDPNKLIIPAGNWNFETYFSASSNGGTPSFYVELYKYNGTTFTLIATSSSAPELIAFGTSLNPYFSTLAVPETVLALTDRLALRYYVTHSGRTITLHTENGHLCEVITTFTTGLTALNGLTNQVQFFAVGTSGTDFAISSVTDTHTFNLPTASATNRGALSSADWTTFNNKTSNLGTVTSVGLSSATSGVTIGSTPITTSGTITLAIATASGSQNGLLSSTDWTTFNNKANSVAGGYLPLSGGTMTGVITTPNGTFGIIVGDDSRLADRNIANTLFVEGVQNTDRGYINFSETTGNALGAINAGDLTWRGNSVITGTGTTNYLPKFTGASTIGNSQVFDNGAIVGIGTGSTGGSRLNILNIASNPVLSIRSQNNVYEILTMTFDESTDLFSITNKQAFAQSGIAFGTNNTERLRIAQSGNLLVGTTTDAGYKLDVNGTGRIGGTNTYNGFLIGSHPNNVGAAITNKGNANATLYSDNASTVLNAETNLFLRTGNTDRLTIASTGAATFASSVMVNNSTVSNEGLSVQYNQAKTFTTQTAVSRWHSNESSGSQIKLNLFAIGNATSSARVFKFQTSNEGVANDGLIVFQSDGGNVGIGSTPTFKFDVESSTLTVSRFFSNATGKRNNILIQNSANYNYGVMGVVSATGSSNGDIYGLGYSASGSTAFTEVLNWTSTGNVLIGRDSDGGQKLQVIGNSLITGETTIGNAAAATNLNFNINGVINKAGRIQFMESGSAKWLIGNGAASENGRFEIYDNTNGTGVQLLKSATSWTTLSDERFKDIIEPIFVNDKLKNIRSVIGKYKTDKEGIRRNFLIAQDLLKVFPEVVDIDENNEKPMGVRYQDIIPILVSAIQELKQEIDTLKT